MRDSEAEDAWPTRTGGDKQYFGRNQQTSGKHTQSYYLAVRSTDTTDVVS